MTRQRDVGRGAAALAVITGLNLTIGVVAYVVAFVIAYGFRDEVGAAEHTFFLVEVTVVLLLSAGISAPVVRAVASLSWPDTLRFCLAAGATLHLTALGLGSIVSAANKSAGSVSADFSTTTDVVVAAVLLGGAAAGASATSATWPRRAHTAP